MSITGTPPLTSSQQQYLGKIAPEGYLARRYNGYTSLDQLFTMMGLTEYEQEVTLRNLRSKGGKKHKSRKSKKYRRNRKRNKSRKY